jgi:hypothetical protein
LSERPADVSGDLVTAAAKAIQAAHASAGNGPCPEFWDEVRIGLAAALLLHEQHVRERIADMLEKADGSCAPHCDCANNQRDQDVQIVRSGPDRGGAQLGS